MDFSNLANVLQTGMGATQPAATAIQAVAPAKKTPEQIKKDELDAQNKKYGDMAKGIGGMMMQPISQGDVYMDALKNPSYNPQMLKQAYGRM